MSFGETLFKIRQSKNMTLKEACGESISISQLSRFEKGKSSMRVDDFHEVLRNLNTSIEEFHHINGRPKRDDYAELLEELNRVRAGKNPSYLEELKEKFRQKARPYSWEQFSLYFVDNVERLSNEEAVDPELVLDYLMQVEDWGEMELRLYITFLFTFDLKTIRVLTRTALKKSQLYYTLPTTKELIYSLLQNTFSTFMYKQDLEGAKEVLEIFEHEYAKQTKSIQPHIEHLFNKGIVALVEGKSAEGVAHFQKAIEQAEFFKQNDLAELLHNRMQTWEKYQPGDKVKELVIHGPLPTV